MTKIDPDNIKARDLMQADVVTLSTSASISEAVETFEDYNIKGAPVVDAAGKLVGVITSTDIARREHLIDGRIATRSGEYFLSEEEPGTDAFEDKDSFSPDAEEAPTVGDWMTPRVVSVYPDQSVRDVCQLMHREGIHRVMVVQNSKLLGVLTSLDIVRHVGGL